MLDSVIQAWIDNIERTLNMMHPDKIYNDSSLRLNHISICDSIDLQKALEELLNLREKINKPRRLATQKQLQAKEDLAHNKSMMPSNDSTYSDDQYNFPQH